MICRRGKRLAKGRVCVLDVQGESLSREPGRSRAGGCQRRSSPRGGLAPGEG